MIKEKHLKYFTVEGSANSNKSPYHQTYPEFVLIRKKYATLFSNTSKKETTKAVAARICYDCDDTVNNMPTVTNSL